MCNVLRNANLGIALLLLNGTVLYSQQNPCKDIEYSFYEADSNQIKQTYRKWFSNSSNISDCIISKDHAFYIKKYLDESVKASVDFGMNAEEELSEIKSRTTSIDSVLKRADSTGMKIDTSWSNGIIRLEKNHEEQIKSIQSTNFWTVVLASASVGLNLVLLGTIFYK